MSVLEIKNLKKVYISGQRVLKKINFKTESGEVLSVIGPNGAGKTTTIKSIMKIIGYSGEIFYNGKVITVSDVIKDFVYLPENKELYESYRVNDLIRMFLETDKRIDSDTLIKDLKNNGIDIYKRVRKLSNGQKSLLYILTVLNTEASVYLLDEPLNSLDPIIRNDVIKRIRKLSYQDKIIIYTSHILSDVETISDRVVILNNGKILEDDYLDNIKSKYSAVCTGNQTGDFIKNSFFSYNINENEYIYYFRDYSDYPENSEKINISFEDIFNALIRGDKNVL